MTIELPALTELLTAQQDCLERLEQVIVQESEALAAKQAEALLTLAAEKNTLLDRLGQTDRALSLHPEQAALTTEPSLAAKVALCREALQRCQELNQRNASLIELNIASLNRLAQALQASRNANSMTYDGKGKTNTISTLGNNLKV
ncbi:flagella synthesis protein FlgN [Shewanella sp. NIFS-20-20]|uniref:flagella synthesis protein FlgN n=1 Tax=Shewanella sp. NIFS-20-20 TaxID=2853806 RepID=UPI001C453221|nr:flagellar protein FlgN [Shewanella sp. NIFS-20-20]MBV7314766.1 flagellar protein FlgN [Shewanella sp. NIFS-20-20]